MRNSWREYGSQLNNGIPVNTIWKMIKKISGKVRCPPIKQLERNGSINKHKRDQEDVGRNDCTQTIGRKLHRTIEEEINYP